MATLKKKNKLAAVSRETPEITRNSQSSHKTHLIQEWPKSTSPRFSKRNEGRVTKNFSEDFSRTESVILGALSKFDEFLLNPQVRTCSVAVPGTSRNNGSENREPTGDRSLGNPCPEAVFSACRPSNLNDSEQEETHHTNSCSNNQKVHGIAIKN